MPEIEDEGSFKVTPEELWEREPIFRPQTLDDFLNWEQVFSDKREDWVRLIRTVPDVEVEAARARLNKRLANDFLEDSVPPRDRHADLATLQPSEKSRMPMEFQARILEAMRAQELCMWPPANLPVHGWAFFGPAGWSKSTLCTAWFSAFAHANADEISYVRWSGLDDNIEFPKNRSGSVNLIWPLSIVSFGPTPTLVIRYSC